MSKAIELINLRKTYQRHFWTPVQTVLKGLNLEVEPGQIFGFLGPNGAGKTTTIKTLMGIIRPSQGQAIVFGKNSWETEPKQSVGFLPESPYFYDYLTGREFLNFCGRLFDINSIKLKDRTKELLVLVNLTHAADLQMRKYSKGMLQRIGLAQALINDPELVVLDEPLTGLDPLGRKEFKDIILDLKSKGKTVFFSSHILPDAEMVCDQVAIINKGKLLRAGNLNQLLNAKIKAVEFGCRNISPKTEKLLSELSLSASQVQEQWLFNLKQESGVPRALDIIAQNGGQVVSIVPQKESLEEFFSREVAQDE
ncbi:ABC transporter ATP-binding protein [candidate division TA06 bacterium]|nr:ABC transporter ATP-binding protein [candidate division TA06 bacterium]